MKSFQILFLFVFGFGMMVSCSEDDRNTSVTVPKIESLNIQGNGSVLLGDSLYFDARLGDAARPLSTLEVEITFGNAVIAKKSIRTKGNSVTLDRRALLIPFLPDIATGDEFKVSFTLINVDGGEAKQQQTVQAVRPQLPETLYLVMSDKTVVALNADAENPNRYVSEEGAYPSVFNAKVATAENLAEAQYVWNDGAENNTAAIGDRFGPDVKFSYSDWLVRQIIFDAFSFKFDKAGVNLLVKINNVRLALSGDYLYGNIELVDGSEIDIQGIEDLAQAYNRDFFAYDAQTDKCTFIGETGNYDVYYSAKYNYLWVNRMSDVAPAAYWIIGAGATSIPRWYADFNALGWSTDDVKQIAYMRSLGAGKYQASVYLSEQVNWGFDIQIFGDRAWGGVINYTAGSLTGDTDGVMVHPRTMADLVMGDGYVPGYFRITLDISQGTGNAKVHIERLP